MALSLASRSACGRVSAARQQGRTSLARPAGLTVNRRPVVTANVFGGGSEGPGEDKKFLSRDEEPEEYWSSKGERSGNNPLSDPLAIIGIVSILFPFLLLLVAIALGYIDLSVYK
ncbi:hypothetical protein Rsub_03903 [Raphidocelis subcapitata]|uniref:Uncharacterized protein n=1 Tax=Raphidocelis subcapitata TaxID=307507 RepID=A0A2V0P1H6_9CHLO|nr:hypothetical protein Rsub_03903 [Raphidocelis subcapitata]|eukprot:GBF91047.1 hypothetical protein Rsub_03903 [Raphidocelis subcapitata]